jgi:hypothetical protein
MKNRRTYLAVVLGWTVGALNGSLLSGHFNFNRWIGGLLMLAVVYVLQRSSGKDEI